MARLPQVGGDDGNWGTILNQFLLESHNPDGSLKAAADIEAVQDALVTKANTSHGHATTDITSGVMATARLGVGTATNTTYLRGDGTWAEIEAPQPEGSTLLSGTEAPLASTGDVGNYYIDQQNNILYGPKISSTGSAAVARTQPGDVTNFGSTSTTDIVLAKPSNTVTGDLLVAIVAHRNDGGSFSAVPSGWSSYGGALTPPASFGFWSVFLLPVNDASALPASWTWTAAGAPWRATGVLFRVTGANLSNPIDTFGVSVTTNPLVVPGVTTTSSNALLIGALMSHDGQSSSFSAPGMSQIGYATASGGSGSSIGVLQQSLTASGPTNSRTISAADLGSERAGVLFAIRSLGATPWPIAMYGIPRGGAAGQVLRKISNSDYSVGWTD